MKQIRRFHCLPLTADRWRNFEALFGPNGACGGRWCMWWRIKRKDFEKQSGEGNRQTMKDIVLSGEIPGFLCYQNKIPIAWCSVAPREAFSVLSRSPILKPVDDKQVWALVCFFVHKDYRGKGMTPFLIQAAKNYAQWGGAQWLEAYPVIPKKENAPTIYLFTGIQSTFLKQGFEEIARRSKYRPIMRCTIPNGKKQKPLSQWIYAQS